jgi:TP901 family phage tail tape measure protein
MSDLDVRIKARLDQNIDREGKEAADGLKRIREEAGKLGRAHGADALERDLKDVSKSSDKANREVRQLREEANKLGRVRTDRAQREMRDLGRAADRTEKKVRDVNRVADSGRVRALTSPMGALSAAAAGIAGGLFAAFGTMEIINGMDRMKDKADELEESLTRLMLTDGEFSPERRAERQKQNDDLALRYAMSQQDILSAQMALIQGGISGGQLDAMIEPILKASKASGSDPAIIAQAVRALVQNLEVAPKDVPAALDAMLAGGKAGSFELEDMARSFPELASVYANSGQKGMQAVNELVAMAQIVRESTGDSSQAATALREILNKIYSGQVIKQMEDAGIDVPKLDAEAKKAGQPLITRLIEEIQKKGMTDKFGLNELVTDTNANLALQALASKDEKYRELLNEVGNRSRGAVDKDYEVVNQLGQTSADRRGAALEASGREIGEKTRPFVDALMDFVVGTISSEFAEYQRYSIKTDEDAAKVRAQLSDAQNELGQIKAQGDGLIGAEFQLAEVKQRIALLEGQLAAMEKYRNLPKGSLSEPPIDGKVKVPAIDSPEAPLAPFIEDLDAGLSESLSKVSEAVNMMRAMLSFTANPVINPIINMPAGATGGGGGGSSSTVNSTTNVSGTGNPQSVANRVTRRQNRQIRASRNGALHDTGIAP